jgi:hypothetical protein
VATVVEGDGAEQFIDALHQVTRYYNADLVVGWTDGYEGVEPEDEEEEQEEQEEEEEQEEGEGEYTQDDLDEMDSDDLKAILEE